MQTPAETRALIPADVLPLLVEYRAAKSQGEIHILFSEVEQVENTLTLSGRFAECEAVQRVRVAIGREHRAWLHDADDVSPYSIPATYAEGHPIRVRHAATKAKYRAAADAERSFLDSICALARLDEALAEMARAA